MLESEEFQALWERIRHKTTYRVHFDNEAMLGACVKALADAPLIPRARLEWKIADIRIGQDGVEGALRDPGKQYTVSDNDLELPDLLTELQDRTQLTRRSIQRILAESGRIKDFQINPQKFIEIAAETINRCKRSALVDGIKYQRSGESYTQELFRNEELNAYLSRTMESQKSVYTYVICDAENERVFADNLEKSSSVKVYTKLPRWFRIDTPLGAYNPDWALVADTPDGLYVYFVVETKGASAVGDLRTPERAKIECAEAHFKAIEQGERPAKYHVVHTFGDLSSLIASAAEEV